MITETEKRHLDIKDIAKNMRQQLAKEMPHCIFSIEIERFSMGQSLHISLMKAPFEAYNKEYTQDKNGNIYGERDYSHSQLNHYGFKYDFGMDNDGYNNGYYLTKAAWLALKRAYELSKEFNYDNSEPQTDYFDVNFYLSMNVGKWNKSFEKITI